MKKLKICLRILYSFIMSLLFVVLNDNQHVDLDGPSGIERQSIKVRKKIYNTMMNKSYFFPTLSREIHLNIPSR